MSTVDLDLSIGPTSLAAASPIDLAIAFVQHEVLLPALNSDLPDALKNKVRNSRVWISRFKRVGDLRIFLKRFDVSHDDPMYVAMKKCGLQTFEDIVAEFELKFQQWSGDCSRITDFIIGETYSPYDILILARNYDTRAGGMFVLEADGEPTAVIIKATLSDGAYPNEWIEEPTKLKYYLKAISGKFNEDFKANKAILKNVGLPIVTFVRQKANADFVFAGLFAYETLLNNADSSKAFVLSRKNSEVQGPVSDSEFVANRLSKSIARSQGSSRGLRLARLAKAPKKPAKFRVVSTVYDRNSDVIAEVLFRARGICGGCSNPAPFNRLTDGTPYLEVHHRVHLANGGDDTVENAIALCPNCHRQRHYGVSIDGIDVITSIEEKI
ncbi:MAG: HNH endonuclease signature motif containing protein [Massilia sp.]